MNPDLMQRYVELRRKRDRLRRELDAIVTESSTLEEQIREEFVQAGVQSLTGADGATLYLAQEIRASVSAQVEPEVVRAIFTTAGLGWLVKDYVHPASVTSWVIEAKKTGQEIPEEVREILNLSETYRVRIRGAGKGETK